MKRTISFFKTIFLLLTVTSLRLLSADVSDSLTGSPVSAFVLSFSFSRAIESEDIKEAKEILTRMQNAEVKGSDSDRIMIHNCETNLKIWDGRVGEAVNNYIQVSTSPLTIIGMLKRYYGSKISLSHFVDERHKLEVEEFRQFFYRKSYADKPSNHYLDLVLSAENDLWELAYFTDDQYFYRYHSLLDDNLNNERPNFFAPMLFSVAEARNKLAIKNWNQMNYVTMYQVRGPFFALRGKITKDNLEGGALQYLISNHSNASKVQTYQVK